MRDTFGHEAGSKMDLINDHAGHKRVSRRFAAKNSEQRVCLAIKGLSHINGPQKAYPYAHALPGALYFVFAKDDDDDDAHPNNNCGQA
jgi:hypothetical protein